MSFLITGGTGFLGAILARKLAEQEKKVTLFDLVPRCERIADLVDIVNIVQGDLTVWPEIMNVIKDNNIRSIFHFGTLIPMKTEENPWACFQTNIVGTMHVLEAARLFQVDRVIFASTMSTYTLGTTELVTDESLQRPITMYGTSKLFGELLGRFYRRKFGLDFRAVRFSAVMGPGAPAVKTIGQYNTLMIESAVLGQPFECYVTEDTAFPVIYIKDAIEAVMRLHDVAEDKIEMVCYNISGVTPVRTAKELELSIKKFIPEAQITYKPDPAVMQVVREMKIRVIDDSNARREWGWSSSFDNFEKIVEDFIKEVRGQTG